MLVHLAWSIDRGPEQQSYHHFETQGIFVRSQLLAYFLAISLISPSKLVLSMIGSRPRPIRLRFSTYRSLLSASLRGLGRCEIGTPVNPEIISARSMSLKVSVIWLKMRTRSPFWGGFIIASSIQRTVS